MGKGNCLTEAAAAQAADGSGRSGTLQGRHAMQPVAFFMAFLHGMVT
jgi:hypothetical protein